MTNAELAILSLIVERPSHGYEIEQVIEARGMRDWTEVGFSSIYYILKKLEEAHLVNGRLEQPSGRGPARRVYTATQAGRAAWHEATLSALATPERCRLPLQLALSNLPGLSIEDSVTALSRYQQTLAEQVEQVRQRRHALGPAPPRHVEAMFAHSLALMEAELSWVGHFVAELRDAAGRLETRNE